MDVLKVRALVLLKALQLALMTMSERHHDHRVELKNGTRMHIQIQVLCDGTSLFHDEFHKLKLFDRLQQKMIKRYFSETGHHAVEESGCHCNPLIAFEQVTPLT